MVNRSTPLKGWLRAHPIAGFILLAYAISYLVGFPFLIAFLAWAPPVAQPLPTYLSRLFVVYGPGIAAVILAAVRTSDGHGTVALLERLCPRTTDVPWAIVVVFVGTIAAVFALLSSGISGVRLFQVVRSTYLLLVAHLVLQIVVVAVGEELGWRGWLLPRLLEKMTRLRATLVVAVVWGLWHMPLLLSNATTTVMFLLGTAGLSVLFTWLSVRTGNRLLVVVLAHAMANAPLFFWEQVGAAQSTQVLAAWYTMEAFSAAGGLILVVTRWPWWQSSCGMSTG